MDASITNVETSAGMRQRQDYWWTTVLARTFKPCSALQTKQPQLLTGDEWQTLLVRLRLAMQSSNEKDITRVCEKRKDFVLAAAIHTGHRAPVVARPELSQ